MTADKFPDNSGVFQSSGHPEYTTQSSNDNGFHTSSSTRGNC